ncbi:hypothetical protein WP50_36880 [Lactiplantibacillus plantarum]|nr:hypothetical protein WP50_36880 [Lactiplantibacillus plantarum]
MIEKYRSRCNPTKVLQLIEEVLNQMALTINVVITGPLVFGIFLWRNGIDACFIFNILAKFRGAIGFIRDNI